MYFKNRPYLGIPAIFYIFIGGRGIGKTYSTQNYVLKRFFKRGEQFLWLRLTEASVDLLLANNGMDFIDSGLIDKYKIDSIETKKNVVYLNKKEAGRIMAISTFYNQKGVALNKKTGKVKITDELDLTDDSKVKRTVKKFKNIVLDEMNKEKNQKNFDISYSFVNSLENICRLDTDRRIFLLGNTLEEASDIMARCFNFIPKDFGTYHLHRKKAVIAYVKDDRTFAQKRKASIAGLLMPEESTFTNKIESDIELISKYKPGKPMAIIRFSKSNYYVWHENGIVSKQKQPKNSGLHTVAMEPYLPGIPYYKEEVRNILDLAQQRRFMFDQYRTLVLFLADCRKVVIKQ